MVAAALLAMGTPKVARAANFAWNQTNQDTYSWITPANWTANSGNPDAIGDIANLNNNILGDNTILLNSNVTLATLNIGDSVGANVFIIQGGVIANPSILPLSTNQTITTGVGAIVLDGLGSAAVTINKSGAGADDIQALVYFNDDLTITSANVTGKITLSGGLRSNQSNIIFDGIGTIEVKTGSLITGGNVTKNGTGTLLFTSANSYGGTTIINAGTLKAQGANVLPNRSPLTVAAGATFDINNTSQAIGSLSGSGFVLNSTGTAASTLTIGRDDTSTSFGGKLSATVNSGWLAVTKNGAGTLTLNPAVASTYTGTTLVTGGSIVLDFANSGVLTSLLGATPLTIAGGDFTLKGRATLAVAQTLGNVNINQDGGKIAVIAGDTTLTKLILGTLSFGTATNAGTLLVSAPVNTQVTITTARPAELVYGNGRAIFTDGTNYNWLTTASTGAPFTLSGLVSAPAISVGAGSTNSTTTITLPTPVSVASSSTTAGLAVVTTANTASLVVGMGVSGAGIPVGASVASISAGVSFTLSVPATATGTGLTLSAGGTSGLVSGMYVTGTGIPANATIASVTNGTTMVISAAATATGTGVTIGAVGYLPLPLTGTAVATANYSINASQTLTTAASTVGTLKIADPAAAQTLNLSTFDLAFGTTVGGLLVTGTNAFTISGTGGLKVGATGGDLIIQNFNSGGLTISAPIKDFTAVTALTRLITAGTGVTTLSGTNTYTGDTMINGGVLAFSNAGASGAGTLGLGVNKPIYIRDGATLRYTGAATGVLANATTANSHSIWLPGGNAIIDIPTVSNNLSMGSVIGGAGGFTKTGTGVLTLTGANAFTGPLIISTGKIVSGSAIIGDNTPVIISSGATWEMTVSDTFGSLAGSGTFNMNAAATVNPGLGQDNSNTTFSGYLSTSGTTTAHNFSKKGSGVLTVAMPVVSNWVGGNTYLDAGVIRVQSGMAQQFNATSTLVVNNATQSAVFDLNGSAQTFAALNFYNSVSNINAQGLVLLGNGGTLTINGNITVNAYFNGGTQAAGITGAAGSVLSLGGGQRTITVFKSLSLAPGEAELVIDAAIFGGGTGGGWIKSGGGTLRVMGQSLLNGTLVNRFDAGLAILDYTTAASTSVTDRINPQGIIELRGGSVSLVGSSTLDVVQNVAGLTLPGVGAGNTGAYSSIELYSSGSKNLVLNLGPITQRLAGTVRFVLPSGTQSSVNGITTSSANDLFTGLVGTLGAALTVTDGSGSTNFATRVGTNIVPVAAVSRDTLSGVLNGENITDTTGYAGSLLNVVSPMTLRFNSAGSSVVSIPDGGILKIISGGILQTASSATTITTLAAGATTLGSATVDVTSTAGLVVGALVTGTGIPSGTTVASVDSATRFTLTSAATASNTGLADLKAGSVTVIQGGTLRSPTRELIVNDDNTTWYANVAGDYNSNYPTKRLLITSQIDGLQGITKTGEGMLSLRAGAQANDFSGLIQLQGGVIELARTGRGSFAIGDFAPIAFSNQDFSVLRMRSDGVTVTAPTGSTALGSPVVKVDSVTGLNVGMLLSGNGIYNGVTVAALSFGGNFTTAPAVALTNAVTTSGSSTITVADTTGLVVGQPVTGAGIPANAYIASILGGTSFTLNANATAGATVNLNVAAVTAVTTAVSHGIKSGETITIGGTGAGIDGNYVVTIDPFDVKRFVFTAVPTNASGTLSIDAGKRFLMSQASFQDTVGVASISAAGTYGETVGYISGGNRQTNANYNLIDIGLGATLTINETVSSSFNGEIMGAGNLRLIGNATLSITNYSRSFGNLIVDSGTLLVSGAGQRLYGSPSVINVPSIYVNRYGNLYLNRTFNTTQDQINDVIDIRLNSAAGTRADIVTGSNYSDTRPLGFYLLNTYGSTNISESINGLYFDSGTSYLGTYVTGNTKQTLSVSGFARANFATGNVRGRALGDSNSATVNASRWLARTSGELSFLATLIGGAAGGSDVTMAAGVTTAGSNVITVTSTTGLAVGMLVTGTGIPAGALVTEVTTTTSFKIGVNATSNNTGQAPVAYTLNKSITPWFVGENGPSAAIEFSSEANMGNSLVTYVGGIGLRALDFATEYSTFATTVNTTDNIREVLTGSLAVGASKTVNGVVLHSGLTDATTGNVSLTGPGAGGILTVGSGAFVFTLNPLATNGTVNGITLGGFDAGIQLGGSVNEYIFHVMNPGSSAIAPRLVTTISSPLNSNGFITKSGRGTLVLSGTNLAGGGVKTNTPLTYWGTTINEGTLSIASLANIGGSTGNLTLAGGTLLLGPSFADDISTRVVTLLSAGGTFDVGANDLTFANAIGGAAGTSIGGITKAGTGSLTLAATNTFLGSTTVANGKLVIAGGANNRLPSAAELFIGSGATGGVLQLGNAGGATDQTVSSLSGVTGVLAADITIVNPGSAYTSAPVVAFDAIGGLMGAQGAQAYATVVGGLITGITLTDAGNYRPGFAPIITLSGGAGTGASIIVRALGTVSNNAIVGGSSAISNLTIDQDIGTIYNGAIGGVGANQNNLGLVKSGVGALTLSGSVLSYVGQTTVTGGRLSITGGQSAALQTSSVKVTTGAILNLNNTVGQKIDLGAGLLNLGAGTAGSASLGLDIGSLTAYDRIVTTGAATAANKVIVNLTGVTGLAAGTYNLFTAGSGLNGATFSIGDLKTFGGFTFGLTQTDTAVTLTTTALPTNLYWRIGADVSWSSLNYANYDTNFTTDSAGTTNAKGFPGIANKLIFSATPGAATTAYVTTLDGNFTVGSLQFSSTPTGITSVTIAQGGPELTTALTISPASSADGITIDDNAGAIVFSAPLILGAPQTWTIAGTGANGSTLSVSGAIGGTAGNNLTIAGLPGAIVNFSGLNTYAGSTSFPGVTLLAGATNTFSPNSSYILSAQSGTDAILRLNGFASVIGSLAGAGFVENSSATTAIILTVGKDNTNTNFAGTIRDGGITALGLTKLGTGALTLSGVNSYTGNTLVNGGALNYTGTYVGSASTSFIDFGTSPYPSTVNVSGDIDVWSMRGAQAVGAVSVYNQTGGTVRLFTTVNGGNQYTARIGYGYFNLTGGTYQMSPGSGTPRFNLNESSATAVGVGYVGGTGVINNSNAGNDWFILAYQGLAQFTVGQGGFVNRQNSVGQVGIVLGGTGTQGTLNIAGGTFDFGGSNLRWGNGGIISSTSFFNVTAGTVLIGNNASVSMNSGRGNLGYNNFAGGTIKANVAMTQGFLPSLLGNTGGAILTADNRVMTPYGVWTNTLFGAIDNSGIAGAASANGALTIDTNGFPVSLPGLTAATGSGVTQLNLAVTGGTGYIGAPLVTFSTAGLVAGGTPASGYAVISGGQVTGIVITSPGTYVAGTVPTITLTGGGGTGASVAVSALNTANTAGRLIKNGLGILSFSGVNTFETAITVNAGTVAVAAGGALNASTLDTYKAGRFLVVAGTGAIVGNTVASLAKIDRFTNAASTGAVAVSPNTQTSDVNLSKSGFNLTGMALGAGMGDVTYTGAFTPGVAGVYRLGGGGNTLNYGSVIGGTYENRVDIVGTSVAFSGSNTFKGGLVLNAGGALQILPGSVTAGYGANGGGLTVLGGTIRWATGSNVDITSGPGAIGGGLSMVGNSVFDTNGNNVELLGSLGNRAATGNSREGLAGGLTKMGLGTLTLSAANTFTGATTVIDGAILLKHSDALALSSINVTNVMTATSVVFDSSVTSNTFTIGGLSGTPINMVLANNAGTPITLRLGNGGQGTTYGAVFSGAGNLVKVGSGTLNLNAVNQTYTGSTTIIAGAPGVTGGSPNKISTLQLTFGTTAGGNIANILPSTTVLNFGGASAPQIGTQLSNVQLANVGNGSGRLLLTAAGANTQAVASTTVGTGASDIVLTSATTNALLLNLGAITRNAGGTLFIGLPANTASATNGVLTSSGVAGALLTDANGTVYSVLGSAGNVVTDFASKNIAGAWLSAPTYTASAAGTANYAQTLTAGATTAASTTVTVASTTGLVVGAAISGPGIPAGATIVTIGTGTMTISAAATATNTAQTFTVAQNINLGESNTAGTANWTTQTINSLRNVAATTSGTTLTITAGNTITIATGGILYGSTAGGASTITGGTIIPGLGKELVVFANGKTLTINSVLGESAAGITDVTFRGNIGVGAGNNDVVLGANNTYTGNTYISGVRVRTVAGALTTPLGTGTNGNVYIYGNNGGQFHLGDNSGSLTRNWYVIGGGWEEGSGAPGAFHGAIRLGANTTLGGTLNLMGDTGVRATGAFATISAKLYGNYDLTARSGWGDGTISFTADNTGWAGSYTIGSGGYRFDTLTSLGSPTVIQLGNYGSIIPGFAGIQAAVIDKVGYGSMGTIALRVATQNEPLDFRSANAASLVLGANENLTYNGAFFPNVQNGQQIYRLGGGGATLTFANSITGNAALVLTGASANNSYGTVTLNPAVAGGNTYQGGTRVAENGPYGGIYLADIANPWSVFGNGQIDFLSLNTNFQLASTITNANGDLSSATNFTRVILSGGLKFDTNRATDFDTVVFAKGVGFYGAGQLTKQGRGTLQLNSVNTYLGNTNIGGASAGSSILMLNNANPFNVGYSINGTISGALVNFNNETNPVVQLATNVTIPGLQAATTGTTVVAGAGTLNLAGYTLTVGGSGTGVMSGYIYGGTGAVGTGGITKNGSGTLTFASDRTGNYTGATTLLGGTLVLNYNTLSTGPTTLINPLSVLVLGGGTLTQTPKTTQTASHTQTFASTTIAPGGSITTKGAPTALFGTTLALGAITRQTGGAVDFGIINNGTGFVTASYAAGLDAGGLLGGWATTNSGASWATLSGGNVVANTVNTGVFTGPSSSNVDSPAVTTIGASPVTINSLRFNSSAASVSLDLAGGLTITSGGVLMTSTVGANAVTISGGTLTTTAPDLVFQIWDNNAAAYLSIGSKVTGNVGVTKVGPGMLILKNGANDFVGTVNIGGSGNFRVEGTGTPLGNVANVVNLNSAAQFQLDGGLTISNPVNIKNASGRSGEATVFLTASAGSSTFSGPLFVQNTTVAGGLFGSNGATLNVTGPITAAPGQVVSTRVGTISYAGGGSYDYFFAMQGTTLLGANNGLATTSATSGSIAGAIVDVASAGTSVFDLNGFSQTVAGLTRISGNSATITNSSGAASTLTVNVGASNGGYYTGDFSFAGQLTGNLALVKSGAGIQFISGVNSFTGGTTISAGTLRIGNANALGGDTGFNGLLTITGGTLDIYGTGNAAIGALAGASGGVITDTGFQLGSSVLSTYSVASSAYAGSINDGNFRSLSLYKDGTGILALTGASTYSGVTKIFEGALSIGNNTALGSAVGATIVSSGAAVQVTGNITSAEAFTVAGTGLSATSGVLQNLSGDNTLSGAITVTTASRFGSDAGTLTLGGALAATNLELAFGGAGNVVVSGAMSLGTAGVTKDGLGTLTLSGANTYTGATAVTAGALRIAHASALGTTSSLVVTAGAALQIDGGVTYAGVAATTPILQNISGNNTWSVALRPTNGGALTLRSDAGVLTLNGLAGSLNAQSADSVNRALVLTGAGNGSLATNFINAVSLTKSGAGVWSFDSAQTYAIETAINGGTIKAGANGYLSANSVIRFANVAGAQLDLNGTTQSVATLEGAGATGGAVLLGLNGELTVGANSAFGGSVDGSGTSKLIKTGTGSFTMGPTSALTGTVAVNVNGGTLSFGGNAGANVTANVASSAILGGSGAFLGSVNVANGGTVQAGNGASGSLAITNLVLGTTAGDLSTLQFRNIDLGASASVLNIGTLTANGGLGSVSRHPDRQRRRRFRVHLGDQRRRARQRYLRPGELHHRGDRLHGLHRRLDLRPRRPPVRHARHQQRQ